MSLYLGSYPHASQFYYASDRGQIPLPTTAKRKVNGTTTTDIEADDVNETINHYHTLYSKANSGPLLAATKSQTMDFRLVAPPALSPLHDIIPNTIQQNKLLNPMNDITIINKEKEKEIIEPFKKKDEIILI